jgi:hypothetical protein
MEVFILNPIDCHEVFFSKVSNDMVTPSAHYRFFSQLKPEIAHHERSAIVNTVDGGCQVCIR